jgi:hypothetical protein
MEGVERYMHGTLTLCAYRGLRHYQEADRTYRAVYADFVLCLHCVGTHHLSRREGHCNYIDH